MLRRHFIGLVLGGAATAAALPGCAAFSAFMADLPLIITGVSDTTLIVQNIADFVDRYFQQHPDPATQAKVDAALTTVRNTLVTLEDVSSTAKDIGQSDVQAALKDFQTAYQALMQLVAQFGVKTAQPGMTAGSNELLVPTPSLMRLRVAQGRK